MRIYVQEGMSSKIPVLLVLVVMMMMVWVCVSVRADDSRVGPLHIQDLQ